MNLFEIADDVKTLMLLEEQNQEVNKETGEIIIKEEDVINSLREELEKNFDNKVLYYRNVIRELDSHNDLISQEIKRMEKLKKRNENIQNRISDILLFVFKKLDIQERKYVTGEKITYKIIDSLNYDENVLKEKYLEYFKTEYKLDKMKIKEDYKKGLIKEGITIIKKENITIK